MGVAPDHPDYLGAARCFPRALRVRALRGHDALRRCRRAARRDRGARAQVGNRHQQGDAIHDAASRFAGPRRARRRGRLRRHDAAHEAASRPAARRGRGTRGAGGALRLRGDAERDVAAGVAAGMRRSSRATATSTRARIRGAGPPTARSTIRVRCSPGFPSSARTRAGVEEQPFGGLAVADPGDAPRLARDQRLTNATSTSSMPRARCRSPASSGRPSTFQHRREPRPSRTARPPATGVSSACQLSGRDATPVRSSALSR